MPDKKEDEDEDAEAADRPFPPDAVDRVMAATGLSREAATLVVADFRAKYPTYRAWRDALKRCYN